MHLAEIWRSRLSLAKGIYLTLTRRCPLSCAHCSTNSTLESEEISAEKLIKFVKTFTSTDKPEIVLLTGGEALLRPDLVIQLADIAHSVGSKVYLLSGMFFASGNKFIPRKIYDAILSVDHFVASLDVFHEAQVPKMSIFKVFEKLCSQDRDVSFQLTSFGKDDPYLKSTVAEIREYFQDQVPILVANISSIGRAKEWLPKSTTETKLKFGDPNPCFISTWPVVAFDGSVVACPHQPVVDGPAPKHLLLGNVAVDDWRTIKKRFLNSSMLRAIRMFGPEYIAQKYSSHKSCEQGYCSSCLGLSRDTNLSNQIEDLMSLDTTSVMEQTIKIMMQESTLAQIPEYADLIYLGYSLEG
ncbi:MAG: radical SAM protein [Symploca sp. SIO3C6]|nr:radical SAM protein [Symploca sp. SIO3C6]